MPRLVAARPGAAVVVADLGYFSYQLQLAHSQWGKTHCLSLVYLYPSANPFFFRSDGASVDLRPYSSTALVRIPVAFAEEAASIEKVALAVNDSENEDIACTRVVEAFTLFRNNSRIRAADIEATAQDGAVLVKAVWKIRQWILDGMKDQQRWEILGAVIVGQP